MPVTSLPLDLVATDDDLAASSDATLLITATLAADVERIARRVHIAHQRAGCPFVRIEARSLPTDLQEFRAMWADALDAAAGGTLFFTDIEAMPIQVQRTFGELLAQLRCASGAPDVRVIAGTTVSLFDCVVHGTFSEPLFYGLNTIHIIWVADVM